IGLARCDLRRDRFHVTVVRIRRLRRIDRRTAAAPTFRHRHVVERCEWIVRVGAMMRTRARTSRGRSTRCLRWRIETQLLTRLGYGRARRCLRHLSVRRTTALAGQPRERITDATERVAAIERARALVVLLELALQSQIDLLLVGR